MRKKIDGVSKAIWIPFFWMLFEVRDLSSWLNPRPPLVTPDAYANLEGSPLNRTVFFILIIIGVLILYRRHLNWRMFLLKNIWILLYFLFGAVSISWSDYPYISLKRLVKASGNVIMAIIILTEQRPDESLGVILRRLAFILLPVSILFIRYYPNLGRSYHVTGSQMFTGVASQKNGLGQICLISGIYFGWNILVNNRKGIGSWRRLQFSIYFTVIPMIIWLLYKADSATSIVGIVLAMCLFLVSKLPSMIRKPDRIFTFCLILVSVFLLLEAIFDLSGLIIVNILKRDPTLTTRVPMWYGLIAMAKNPVVGVGYESFWLGSRLVVLWQAYGGIKQAHNGYLETYLNLGLIGLSLLVTGILSGLLKVRKQLKVGYPFTILRLVFILIVAVYNWTEATFYGISNMWLLLFLGILDTKGLQEPESINNVNTHHETVPSKVSVT